MSIREALARDFEQGLFDAVDGMVAALGEGDGAEADGGAAAHMLQAYLAAHERITAAAQHEGAGGLRIACTYMEANLLDLVGRGGPVAARELALLEGWPAAVVDYCADRSSAVAVDALLAHLSDPAWSMPLASGEASVLRPMMLSDAAGADGQWPRGAGDAVASPPGEAGATATEQADGPAADGAREAAESHLADGSFARMSYATRIEWMADLAQRKELAGVHEVCERLGRALEVWESAGGGISATQGRNIDDALALAKDIVVSAGDDSLPGRLLAVLASPTWPDPLVGDEWELVSELLQADRAACLAECGEAQAGREAEASAAPVARERDGADDSQCDWLAEQLVGAELLGLLAAEIQGIRAGLDSALDASCAEGDRGKEGADQYVEELERLAGAADAVGLFALKHYLGELAGMVSQNGDSASRPARRDVLALLPGAVAGYLGGVNDRSAAEVLVDLLRSDAWEQPLGTAEAARLVRGLGMVKVTQDVAAGPARQVEATPDDVSLAFPDDINQELLEGLLQELPIQTGEFSSAVQRIAGGQGRLGDVDTAKRAAHTLKGAANTVGVRGIANLTHHIEDMLIALSAQETMPNRALAETLIRASDCLEAMSEAVAGAGPEPEDAQEVLQDVLNWANRIDREGVPEGEEAAGAAHGGDAADAVPAKGAPAAAATPMVRVPAGLIDELLRLVGETIISTGQIRDRLAKVARQNQVVRAQASSFLGLAGELEELVDIGSGAGAVGPQPEHADFDPLEFEHYSELHTVSRRLIEAATDAREMGLGIDEDVADLSELAEAQERLHQLTQAVVMQTRMVPVSTVLSRLQRGVRQACRLLDKEASLQVSGADTLIDSNILNELIDPLMHVLRNAVDHGIEAAAVRVAAGKPAAGRIQIAFAREGNQVVARCSDDGGGLDFAAIRRAALERGAMSSDQALSDDELARLILAPGFSTRSEATQVSGRGIGMDIVRNRVQQMKGSLNLRSRPGEGLTVELRLPAALISTHALIVRSGGKRLAVSSHGIQDIHYVLNEQLHVVGGRPTYRLGDHQLQVVELETLLGLPLDRRNDARGGFPLIIVRLDSGALRAVRAQEVHQSRNLVVKALGRYVPKLVGVVGATILGDGSVAAVIDLPEVMDTPEQLPRGMSAGDAEAMRNEYERGVASRMTALVVDDSLSARRATAQFMKDAGFDVRTAIDGLEAVSILENWAPDVMLVDMEMPRMNGLELTSHVRASRGKLAKVPIVMITSRSTAKHRKQAEAAGVSVYLTKPFSDEELLRHVSTMTMV